MRLRWYIHDLRDRLIEIISIRRSLRSSFGCFHGHVLAIRYDVSMGASKDDITDGLMEMISMRWYLFSIFWDSDKLSVWYHLSLITFPTYQFHTIVHKCNTNKTKFCSHRYLRIERKVRGPSSLCVFSNHVFCIFMCLNVCVFVYILDGPFFFVFLILAGQRVTFLKKKKKKNWEKRWFFLHKKS